MMRRCWFRRSLMVVALAAAGAGAARADDGLLLPVNNADSPPFATLIKVDKSTGKLTVLTRITFANATNGAEQPIWNAWTGKFYISIPEVDGITADGAVGVI